jgi:hypothetical protein
MKKRKTQCNDAIEAMCAKRAREGSADLIGLLPDFLVQEIIEYIVAPELGIHLGGLRSLMRVARTCRRARALVRSSPIWRRVEPAIVVEDMYREYGYTPACEAKCGLFSELPHIAACERLGDCSRECYEVGHRLIAAMTNAKHATVLSPSSDFSDALGMLGGIWQFDKIKRCRIADGISVRTKSLETLRLMTCVPNPDVLQTILDIHLVRAKKGFVATKVTAKGYGMSREFFEHNPGITSFETDVFARDAIYQIGLISELADLRCNVVTADDLPMVLTEPLQKLRVLTANAERFRGTRIPEPTPWVLRHASELFALIPNLETLDMSHNHIPPDGISSIASLPNLVDVALWVPDDPIGYRDSLLALARSDGAPFRRMSIRGCAGLHMSWMVDGKRLDSLEELSVYNRSFTADDAASISDRASRTLRALRVGAVPKCRESYRFDKIGGILTILERCRALRELEFELGRASGDTKWPAECPSLRSVRMRLTKNPEWYVLGAMTKAFSRVTVMTFRNHLGSMSAFAGFIRSCPNVVRVNTEGPSQLRLVVPKHVEVVQVWKSSEAKVW